MMERIDGYGGEAERLQSVKSADLALLSYEDLERMLEAEKKNNKAFDCGSDCVSFFEGLSDVELLAYVELLRSRLEEETEMLERFARLGLDPFVPDLLSIPLPYPTRTVEPGAPEVGSAGVAAFYSNGEITVVGEPPSLAERLALLASRGIISNDVFHEVFHGLQDDRTEYTSLADVLEAVERNEDAEEAKTALAEAHAWLACLPGFRHEVLIDVIGSCYSFEDEKRLGVAFELLYNLIVLGLDDEAIGQLVGEATWCDERRVYPELDQEVERLLELAGMTKADLERERERSHLVERVQAVRAVGIARELVHDLQLARTPASELQSPEAEVVTL
ncbi:MAG: hypothetical protein ACYC1C_11080 [Chloroflexota bacterium]